MDKATIKIEGMTCGHCQKSVNKLITAVEGGKRLRSFSGKRRSSC